MTREETTHEELASLLVRLTRETYRGFGENVSRGFPPLKNLVITGLHLTRSKFAEVCYAHK